MTREEAIRVIKDHIDTYVVCHGEEDTVAVSIDNVDVEALDMAIKALSVEPCEDAISRKAVSDAMYELCGEGSLKDDPWRDNPHIDSIIDAIEHLPSVTPKQKMGHWEWLTEDKYRCSNCNHETRVDECMNKPLYDFCPFCGEKMGEGEE